jgi:hypothetical protein
MIASIPAAGFVVGADRDGMPVLLAARPGPNARTGLLESGLGQSMFDGQSEGGFAAFPPTHRQADVLGLVRR